MAGLALTLEELRNIVASKLVLDWSPKQISGWLKTRDLEDESLRVSHETIYRSLFIQALESNGSGSRWSAFPPSTQYLYTFFQLKDGIERLRDEEVISLKVTP